jgi:azurin
MKFDVTQITAKPGESIRVRLTTVSAMPKAAMAHNFVLLAAGTDASAFAMAAAMARTTAFIPAKLKASVLASTTLAGAGETVEVTFKAPTKRGKYVFLCSFPGHYNSGMTGTLTVK